jgi:septal ring factor EnvC (AmiA/AmiB activator)
MSTKTDVSNFLQLGAKYELILIGLFDEITKQREITEKIQSKFNATQATLDKASSDLRAANSDLRDSQASLDKASSDLRESLNSLETESAKFQTMAADLAKASAKQRKVNFFLIFLGMAIFVSNLVVWVTKF